MALTKATLIDLNSNELVLDLDADTSITADTDDTIHFKIAGSDEITMTAGAIAPSTSDGNALGTTSLMFSDLFLASGSVVNFNNGDVTLTHASNTLVLAGGSLDINGQELILDADADTSITASTDDQIDFRIGGSDLITFTAGKIDLKNAGTASQILFYCESSNAHAQTLIGAPHSEGANNVLTLPGTGGDARLVSTTSTAILTNKTLTSPVINTGTFGTSILPTSADGTTLGSASKEFSDLFLADASTIQFGNDQDVTLTHVADTGILLNSTNVIQFNDASQNIGAPSATVLDINATDEIELNATLVDINANVEISGTAVTTGVHTFTAVPVFPNNTIETADIQADAITGDKIADNAINSEHYTDGSIDTAHIADSQVTLAKTTGLVGKQTIWVPAQAMTPTASNGCAVLATVETTSGRPDMNVLDFDKDSDEFAQFSVAFPKAWNAGTITFQFFWSGIAATTGVAMSLQGVSFADNDSIDTAYGTAVVVQDDAQGAVEELLVSAESGAVTIAGSPGDNELCYFRVGRDVSDGNDDMAGDCRLHGIKLFFTNDALNDA